MRSATWLASAMFGSIIGYVGTTWYKYNVMEKKETPATQATTSLYPLSLRAQEILKYGPDIEKQENIRILENYVASLNFKTKTPNWVVEHLTSENTKGDGDRSNVQFVADASVDERFRAENEDYWNSGYSRGHLSPASNNKKSMQAMRDTFILNSNIVPQDYQNNAVCTM